MDNCKNCGAPLTLENLYCPHCGTPNPEAQEHFRRLNKLSNDYEKTKFEIVSEVKKTKKGYNLLIVLVLLMLANLIMIPFHESSYQIADKIIASRISEDEVKAQMDQLLADGEYGEFSLYYDKYDVDYQKFRDYYPIHTLSYSYRDICNNITNFLYEKDPYNDPLVRACQNIKEFYEDYDSFSSRKDFGDMTYVNLDKLKAKCDSLIKAFLKLTDEDISGIAKMSDAELVILATRRMSNEEE